MTLNTEFFAVLSGCWIIIYFVFYIFFVFFFSFPFARGDISVNLYAQMETLGVQVRRTCGSQRYAAGQEIIKRNCRDRFVKRTADECLKLYKFAREKKKMKKRGTTNIIHSPQSLPAHWHMNYYNVYNFFFFYPPRISCEFIVPDILLESIRVAVQLLRLGGPGWIFFFFNGLKWSPKKKKKQNMISVKNKVRQ